MSEHYAGKGCNCAASGEFDCCCADADWRSKREVELAEENGKLKAELAKHQESEFHPDWSLLEATRSVMEEQREINFRYYKALKKISETYAIAYTAQMFQRIAKKALIGGER